MTSRRGAHGCGTQLLALLLLVATGFAAAQWAGVGW